MILIALLVRDQCDQVGRFLKVLGHKLSYTSSPTIFGDIFGYFYTSIISKFTIANFWATF